MRLGGRCVRLSWSRPWEEGRPTASETLGLCPTGSGLPLANFLQTEMK